jgi:hypothetical protein
MSYFDTFEISMSEAIIFNFREWLDFYSNYLMITFKKFSSRESFALE